MYVICIVLGIIRNLEMIESIWEKVHRLYANIMLIYVKDLSIHRFFWLYEVLKPILHGYHTVSKTNEWPTLFYLEYTVQ